MSKASASLLGWGSVVNSWNKLNCRLKLKKMLSDFGCLPALCIFLVLYLVSFLICRVPYCCEQTWLVCVAVGFATQRFALGINFMCFGEIKTKWSGCGCERRWGDFSGNEITGKLFVFGFEYILRKRKSFLLWCFLLWFNLVL